MAKKKPVKKKPVKKNSKKKSPKAQLPAGPKVSRVLDDQLEQFIYWIKERHSIFLKRHAGKPWPWTSDMRLQFGFFTNPFRENDKTTQWFRENLRDPRRDDPSVLFATLLFRRFNLVRTAEALIEIDAFDDWDPDKAYEAINALGSPYISAAYVMSAPPGSNKLKFYCRNVTHYWRDVEYIIEEIEANRTLRHAHQIIKDLPYIGPFSGYEVVSDLRYTYLLENAPDILTWASFGPGAKKGFNRLMFGGEKAIKDGNIVSLQESDRLEVGRELLTYLREEALVDLKDAPEFEMRELEHSLCEFGKFMSLVEGQRPKRWYTPPK